MVKYGMEFVVLLLVFCRFDVIFNLSAKVTELSGFTGKSITLTDKFFQYTSFIVDCFVAPNAGINSIKFDHVSWQLTPATGVNFLGVIILALCAISAWINRGKKSSLLAAGWVGFSVILLLILGWGTKENGLILYALYFGWAFFSLLFQLFEKVEDKLNTRLLIPIITALCMTVMAIKNIPAITELLQFAINFYSV